MRVMKDSGIAWMGRYRKSGKYQQLNVNIIFKLVGPLNTTHEDYFLGGNIWVITQT